jgi:hypothetical protein
MFGGLALMYRGHMLVGVICDLLMARVGPTVYERVPQRPGLREMHFNEKSMKGYVHVDPAGFEPD